MIDRFRGAQGERRVREELARQSIVENDAALAAELAAVTTLHGYAAGEALMQQGGSDCHIDFILAGSVMIEVSGQAMARRQARQHVGELTMIDPSAPRSATVRALERTVVARLQEGDFRRCAEAHPHMLRALLREVARRLRDRGKYVRPRNPSPVLFVGCTSEGVELAEALRVTLGSDDLDVRLFTDDRIFRHDHLPAEDLRLVAEEADLAVLWATPDDAVTRGGATHRAPRDSLLVTIGLFLGVLDRERTIVVRPRGTMKLPSDHLGVTTLEYDPAGTPSAAGARVGEAVRRRVRDLGAR